jgi:hypothetical protein
LLAGCSGGGANNPPPVAPVISYGATNFTLNAQIPFTATPTNSGGAVASWAISAGLPTGLSFNTTTGVISGTVTDPTAPASVTVTAKNAGGSGSVALTIGVQSTLLNLGALSPDAIAVSGSSVLTMDRAALYDRIPGPQHWVLWDYASGAIVSEGDGCPAPPMLMPGFSACGSGTVAAQVALAGSLAVVPYTPDALQILAAGNGNVLATIKDNSDIVWFQLASDASYVCTIDANAITAWSVSNGAAVASHAGNYTNASVSCGIGEMRIANGPAGPSVIERVALPGGETTISTPFAGTFNSWFADGSAFLTSVGTTIWVYSPTGAQLDTRTLGTTANLGGTGQWFWNFTGSLNVYRVGASATPTAVYPLAPNPPDIYLAASGPILTFWDTAVHIVDLSGATPVKTDYPGVPINEINLRFAAVSAQKWIVSSYYGAVLDGATLANATPRFFDYGSVWALAGSPSRLVVATDSGQTLVYDTSNFSLVTTIRRGLFAKIQVSSDGGVLATLGPGPFGSSVWPVVQTISLPSGAVINTGSVFDPVDITLSSSGLLLGQVAFPGSNPIRQVTAVSGGPILWSDNGFNSPIYLSSDDTLIAVAGGTPGGVDAPTAIYLNDKYSAPLPGSPVGWLSNNNILQSVDTGDVVYTLSATPAGLPTLPHLTGPIQIVSSDLIYDSSSNAIYSLSTGAKTWSGPVVPGLLAGAGVLAGARVAYGSGNRLITEPY